MGKETRQRERERELLGRYPEEESKKGRRRKVGRKWEKSLGLTQSVIWLTAWIDIDVYILHTTAYVHAWFAIQGRQTAEYVAILC